jgi:hypothetical protein
MMEVFTILCKYDGGEAGDANCKDAVRNFLPPYFRRIQVQTGMCNCYSWEINLLLSFVSLVLWSILLATVSSAAALRNEQNKQSREQKLRQDRLDFVRRRITVKVSMKLSLSFSTSTLPLHCPYTVPSPLFSWVED